MRWNDIFVDSCAVALGRKEDTDAAVADGRYDKEFQLSHGYHSVSVADEGHAMDLAVSAARLAIARAPSALDGLRMLIHASCETQGPPDIQPASYIQGAALGGLATAVPAVEVKQACNGGMAALELAAGYLTALPAGSILITTSDRFAPGENRYRSDPGNLPGDGGTGLILSKGRGVARLLSTALLSNGDFAAPLQLDRSRITDRASLIAEQKRLFQPMLRAMLALQVRCVRQALADAGADSGDVKRWVFANAGAFMVNRTFRETFGIQDAQTTWDWGRTIGHFGSGDQVGGLAHLLQTRALAPGDLVALFGNGAGFSYGCAVLEIVALPDWPQDQPYH